MMGISTQTITVDLSKQLTRPQVVRLGQGDKRGTTLVADIYDNGVAYSLNGKTARFSMRAPDGSSSYSVAASSYNGNKATFNIDETYAASIAGKTETAYIEVLSGSTVICSTSRITVIVYRSASQGLPVSGAYSDALEEAIAAANAAIEAMGDISELAVPEMTASVRGGAKLGTGLAVVDGALGVDLSNVNTGVLPVARGGTGVTTAAAERERLGLGGDHVLAGPDDQAVFGRYNVLDEDDAYAAIVGNGTAEDDRSNALGILWNGTTRRFIDVDARQGGTKPSELVSIGEQAYDTNGDQVFYSYTSYSTSGRIYRSQLVRKSAGDGSALDTNGFYFGIEEDGSPYWSVRNAPQFRNAIGLGIYASLTNQSATLNLTTSAQKVPLHGTFTQYGGCSESGNGIKVPVAGAYLITGLAYFATGFAENDTIHIELRKNDSSLGDSIFRVHTESAYQSFAAPTRIVSLAENDVITLHAWNQMAARGTVTTKSGHGITLVKIA